ncbi:hypothetical protein QCA50_010269 [Cerrena zonata]|uniref:Uncharacterized protein n=1 Tax=Cerrena zonata TaxID=2478898 RepID=A0AAW0G4R2_9APHY
MHVKTFYGADFRGLEIAFFVCLLWIDGIGVSLFGNVDTPFHKYSSSSSVTYSVIPFSYVLAFSEFSFGWEWHPDGPRANRHHIRYAFRAPTLTIIVHLKRRDETGIIPNRAQWAALTPSYDPADDDIWFCSFHNIIRTSLSPVHLSTSLPITRLLHL